MTRKEQLIREAQEHIRAHHANLDFPTKVLYDKVQFCTQQMTPDQLAEAIRRGCQS